MPQLTITTNDGELVETIDLTDYDLSRPLVRGELMLEIVRGDKIACDKEDEDLRGFVNKVCG